MTYGTLDLLYKLINDNAFGSVDDYPIQGQVFVWDDTLVFNDIISITNTLNKINYATAANHTGGQYYTVAGGSSVPTPVSPTPPPVNPTTVYNYPFSIFTVTAGLVNTPGAVTYTSSTLVGLENYPVQATQLDNFMNMGTDITYNKTAGSFTIIIPGFYLLDGYSLNVFPNGMHI
jgi:hypothetical protein